MTFFALLLFPPILLLGVDGHGALVWPPNWTDGQPIPLEQRLNHPTFVAVKDFGHCHLCTDVLLMCLFS